MNTALTKYATDFDGDPPSFKRDSPKYSFEVPLVFEPGEGWEYGVSLDWVGQMVEQVTGKPALGEYMQENIFDVLGMDLTSFRPWDHQEIMKRMGGWAWRDAETGKIKVDESGWFPLTERPQADYGGGGVFTCARDYIKVLMSLLINDGKLLKPESVDAFFQPQLKDTTSLRKELSTEPISIGATNGLPKDRLFNRGFGGCLCMDGIQGHCGRGMLFWSGLPNSFWFIDREAGTCGVYLSHIFPPGDASTQALNAEFQRMVYSCALAT